MNNPNIVDCIEVFKQDGLPCLVREYYPKNLAQYISEFPDNRVPENIAL